MTCPRVCFVIPTYNEAANVTPLLERLTALYPGDDTAFLIVDDESPDGTGRLVREFAATDRRVHLLPPSLSPNVSIGMGTSGEGLRRGLGRAYVRGITHALNTIGAGVIVQMDADFSHDPADAQRLLDRLAGGADVAIGSRYVAGGAIDERWGARRRLLSRWGNRFARRIAGIKGVRDCTAGFRAIRADLLRAANIGEVRVQGYVFQVVLLHRLIRAGAQVVEEPVFFRDRTRGHTKLGTRDLVEFLLNVWWLRFASYETFVKFALTGLSGVFVNLGSFQLLLELGVPALLASPIAIEASIVSNFLINNYWTFGGRRMIGKKRYRGLRYNLVSLVTLALSYGTFIGLSALFPDALPVLLQGCGILPAMLFNYFLNSRWTFREAEDAPGGHVSPGRDETR